MRVGIDASAMIVAPQTGIENYTSSLIKALTEIRVQTDIEYYLYFFAGNVFTDKKRLDVIKQLNQVAHTRVWPLPRGYDLVLSLIARADHLSLLHMPNTKMPRFAPCPVVITVHDLCWLNLPDEVIGDEKRLAMAAASCAIRKAQGIIAVSESTRRDVISHFRVEPDNVQVTREGSTPNSAVDYDKVKRTTAKYGLDSYILYLGTLQTRKNLVRLINAFQSLVVNHGVEQKLVLAGGKGHGWQEIVEAAERSDCSDRIDFLGYVPADDIGGLYSGADVFVYPSLCEGFGLPIIEAMSFGVPVVASLTSSLPEVGGDAAIYCDPYNEDDIAMKILGVIRNRASTNVMIARGLSRSREFTWSKTALDTISAYSHFIQRIT
jgi:glycosyltransferase involved in cell wall biosynthesis